MNDSLSDFHIGVFYSQGVVLPRDEKKAMEYFKKSADKDLAEGQFAYGMSLLLGSNKYVFQPIFPSILNHKNNSDQQNQLDNQDGDDEIVLGSGWVTQQNGSKEDFDYRKWLKEQRKKTINQRENIYIESEKKKEQIKTGIRWLTLSAIQNYSHAQFSLGMILLFGKYEIDKNEKQGLDWLQQSFNNGDLNACFELGKYYYSMIETISDQTKVSEILQKSLTYFKHGSNHGSGLCSYWLGTNFISVDSSITGIDSIEYLKLAVNQDNPNAPTFLAMLYRDGIMVDQDKNLFHKYLDIGISRGDSLALLCIGELYFNGDEGYEINYKKALHYFTESSNRGNSDAYLNQGVMYFNGYGTDIDYSKAFYCYQNSFHFNPNNKAAISNLYTMHKEGLGVPKSEEIANYYLSLLNKLGENNNQNNDEVTTTSSNLS
eukprot:gene6253-7786_t